MESGVCEEQLNQVETLLQTVRLKGSFKKKKIRGIKATCILLKLITAYCKVKFFSVFVQDVRMLSSGKPAQHTAEMEADLEKAEGMIRFLFNDVQLLKDGRHLQAEQMYRRCRRNELIKSYNIEN